MTATPGPSANGAGDELDPGWSYTLVTPDGVISDAIGWILPRLRDHGFRVSTFGLVSLDAKVMYELYTETEYDPDQLRVKPGQPKLPIAMFEDLYALAPACLLMLRHPDGRACPKMADCKGGTRPEYAAPGSIRAQGENVILNFLHSPDDQPSALRELRLLVGAAETRRLVAMTRCQDDGVNALAGVDRLDACLPAFHGPDAMSFPAIANRVGNRVLQRLVPIAFEAGTALDRLTAAHAALGDQRAELGSLVTSRERLQASRRLGGRIGSHLSSAADSLGEPLIADGVRALTDLYELGGPRDLAPALALAGRGVYLAAAEKAALEAHRHAFVSNEFLDEIYSDGAG
ncbi:nucleoside-diphosphate kinase [Actinomadura roseirufa]|uniref:nucleoside-diphosphate kinase n=1 Tax=Actinomadura roseirufa TaxID=2094049 RepID=UPI001041363F|nr:nucleoside-diphosphate kinase [Actinomadura roseirufa]